MKTRNDPDRSDTVYFFGTCLMDAVYPDAGMAAIRLLESQGVKVVFPRISPAAASRPTTPDFPGGQGRRPQQIRCFPSPTPSSCLPDPVPA
jgi:L-lactate dehydrogenase complex protein LldE